MNMFDRLSKVVKSEWSARFNDDGSPPAADDGADATTRTSSRATVPATAVSGPQGRSPSALDVDGALRVLELSRLPGLDEVRRQYRVLARRYHPKTQSPKAAEVEAAHVVLESLTDALFVLEEHLLPLPP